MILIQISILLYRFELVAQTPRSQVSSLWLAWFVLLFDVTVVMAVMVEIWPVAAV